MPRDIQAKSAAGVNRQGPTSANHASPGEGEAKATACVAWQAKAQKSEWAVAFA